MEQKNDATQLAIAFFDNGGGEVDSGAETFNVAVEILLIPNQPFVVQKVKVNLGDFYNPDVKWAAACPGQEFVEFEDALASFKEQTLNIIKNGDKFPGHKHSKFFFRGVSLHENWTSIDTIQDVIESFLRESFYIKDSYGKAKRKEVYESFVSGHSYWVPVENLFFGECISLQVNGFQSCFSCKYNKNPCQPGLTIKKNGVNALGFDVPVTAH